MVDYESLVESSRFIFIPSRMLSIVILATSPYAVEFVCEGQVSRAGHDAFLVQATQNANCTPTRLNQVNRRLEIQPKIDIVPFDTLPRIFFLLQHERDD